MGRQEKWTTDQEQSIIDQLDVLRREPSQVLVPGRTSRAVDHKISDLRHKGLLKTQFVIPWSVEEEGSLLVQVGMELKSLDKIKIQNRTAQAIYAKIKNLRREGFIIKTTPTLRHQQVIARARRKKVNKRKNARKKKIRELKRFLKGQGKYWPSEIVAQTLKCTADWVGRWRKRWGMELNIEEAKIDPVFMARHVAMITKRLQAKKDKKRKKEVERKEKQYNDKLKRGRLEEIFRSLFLQRTSSRLERCAVCGSIWYYCSTFFRQKNGNLTKICVACENNHVD